MPVFARTKLMIHEDCLVPGTAFLTLNYSGPNPQELYTKIKEIFFTVFKHEAGELQEREFSWDRSGGKERFKVRFDLTKDMDTFTFVQMLVDLDGEAQPSRQFGKEGTAKIQIEGRLRTEYPQDTLWQRSLFYEMFRVFYHKVIYEETRRRYKDQCRDWCMKFQEELKAFLNILPKAR